MKLKKNKKRVISNLSIIIKDREFNEFDCLEKFFNKMLKLNHLDVFGRTLDIFFYYDSIYTPQQRKELLKLLITSWKNLLFSIKKDGYTINMSSYLQMLLFNSKCNIDFTVNEIINVLNEYRSHKNFDLFFLNYIYLSIKEKNEIIDTPNPSISNLLDEIKKIIEINIMQF